ncbi:MAG TPA: cobalt-precorrin-5B (C(1))-methyltransferase CbiD [Syntrophomonadaceae bacterium]|nr:cobalt-precorrin-5B (C(1))-methyltransferase CbiD [Syntrophomonadaceae bacterium]
MKTLRYGYSTGTCAAAACKAALLKLLNEEDVQKVVITLPVGSSVEIPVKKAILEGAGATAEVVKDAGDDPDVTHGISICSHVELLNKPEIIIMGGQGIGQVTKPGLAVPVGEAAINPVPRKMITTALQELLPTGWGARASISAPEGEKVARKTMNPRLGIMGGISILGTSGLVRPMSQEAYLDSLIPQIRQAQALGHKTLVLTPGGMGARMAAENGIHPEAVVQTSNFIGAMLEECAHHGVEEILLFGHIGKIVKVAGGIFNTHSKVADARREILAVHAALLGAPLKAIQEIMEVNTMDAAVGLITDFHLQAVYASLAAAASQRCQARLGEGIIIGTVLYALDGTILGFDETASKLGGRMGWSL